MRSKSSSRPLAVAIVLALFVAPAALAQNADALFKDGYNLYSDKKYSQAMTRFEEVERARGEDGTTHYYMALCCVGMKQNARAAQEFKRAINTTTDPKIKALAQKGLAGIPQETVKQVATTGLRRLNPATTPAATAETSTSASAPPTPSVSTHTIWTPGKKTVTPPPKPAPSTSETSSTPDSGTTAPSTTPPASLGSSTIWTPGKKPSKASPPKISSSATSSTDTSESSSDSSSSSSSPPMSASNTIWTPGKKMSSMSPTKTVSSKPKAKGNPVKKVIEFRTTGCDDAKFVPVLEKAKTKYSKLQFETLDGDDPINEELKTKYNVKSFPTIVYLDGDGKMLKSSTTAPGEKDFFNTIDQLQ